MCIRKVFLCAAALLFAISGCSFEATPDMTLNLESIQPSKAPAPATRPADTDQKESWSDHAVRALIPVPPGLVRNYREDGTVAVLKGTSVEKLEEYCKALLNTGFDAYYDWDHYESIDGPQFVFYGRNTEGIVVRVDTYSSAVGTSYLPCQEIMIWDYRLKEGTQAGERWGADAFQQLLPDPGYGYIDSQLTDYNYEGQPMQCYYVEFSSDMRYEACKAYAKLLRGAGFVYEETVDDKPFLDQYSFWARNSEGCVVELVVSSSVEPGMMLLLPEQAGVD